MNRRVVACSRCEKQLYAYPSEAGPFFCETVRCESTEPQNTEKRPGDLRQDTNRAASGSDTYQEASAISETTGTPTSSGTAPVEEWHPSWCARGEMCTPNCSAGDVHYSRSRVGRTMVPTPHGPDGGESFRAEVRLVESTEAGESFDQSADLVIRNEEGVGDLELHIGANRMRRLAAWLTEMADWVDAVHAGRDPQAVIQEQEEARR